MEAQVTVLRQEDANPSVETQLERQGQLAILEARSMAIENQQDYERAGKFLVELKERAKKIKDYWAPTKAAAKAAHQAVVDREKEMLNPLAEAEKVIKASMVSYNEAVERARRQAAEEARRRQQEETERLLAQAIQSQEAGDDQAAAIGMAMAEMVDEMVPAAQIETPKAAGTSVSKSWKARVIDETAVPAYANGMELRKINMSALNSIARMTKGTAKIPGVEFYEEFGISARS